jgi:hypothetical protein
LRAIYTPHPPPGGGGGGARQRQPPQQQRSCTRTRVGKQCHTDKRIFQKGGMCMLRGGGGGCDGSESVRDFFPLPTPPDWITVDAGKEAVNCQQWIEILTALHHQSCTQSGMCKTCYKTASVGDQPSSGVQSATHSQRVLSLTVWYQQGWQHAWLHCPQVLEELSVARMGMD